MHAAHRSRQPQQIMFTEATTRLQMSRNSQREKKRGLCVCVCERLFEKKRTENLCSVASFTKQMKIGNQFGENTSLIPIFSYNLLPQLHISKKKRHFFLWRKLQLQEQEIFYYVLKPEWSVSTLCAQLSRILFFLLRYKKRLYSREKEEIIWKKLNVKLYEERHWQPVSIISRRFFLSFLYFNKSTRIINSAKISISVLISWFLIYFWSDLRWTIVQRTLQWGSVKSGSSASSIFTAFT